MGLHLSDNSGVLKHLLQRRDVLHRIGLNSFWELVTEAQFRQRPHPRVNSIAWNIWHISRAEDASLNRFIADRPQVLDEVTSDGRTWLQCMNVPWRHGGTDMTFDEVDELNRRVDLAALRGYNQAVAARVKEIVNQLDSLDPATLAVTLDALVDAERLRATLDEDGLAYSNPAGMFEHYRRWSKGRFLFTHGLTHSFEHLGEMNVIASLLGVSFD